MLLQSLLYNRLCNYKIYANVFILRIKFQLVSIIFAWVLIITFVSTKLLDTFLFLLYFINNLSYELKYI